MARRISWSAILLGLAGITLAVLKKKNERTEKVSKDNKLDEANEPELYEKNNNEEDLLKNKDDLLKNEEMGNPEGEIQEEKEEEGEKSGETLGIKINIKEKINQLENALKKLREEYTR
jgi:hypothetical protein